MEKAWTRIHIDFLSPLYNFYYFVLIDATSKWIECFAVKNITSYVAIDKLRETFSRFGLPREIVSDNAKSFTSDEFQNFLTKNGIKHLTGPPFCPKNNGEAESAVKIMKLAIHKGRYKDTQLPVKTIIER